MNNTLTGDKVLIPINKLRTWGTNGQRAPHKPLLILFALGRLVRKEPRLIPFTEAEKPLRELLNEFAPPRDHIHPEYPFWRLQNDGLWDIPQGSTLRTRIGQTDPPITEMRKISGGFSVPIFNILCNDQALINEISSVLLSEHFPESLHNDILSAVGLSINKTTLSSKEPRDPKFAKTILSAYGYRCAICNLEIHVAGQSIGLEAAHVKWHSAGGSSTVDNGLCLCPIHHKGLDLGIIGLDKDLMIHISQDLRSDMHEDHMFGRHNKLPLLKPLSGQSSISVSNIEWHTKQVFRSPARP